MIINFYKIELKNPVRLLINTVDCFLTLKKKSHETKKEDHENDIGFVQVSLLIVITSNLYYFATYKFLSEFLSFSSFIQ